MSMALVVLEHTIQSQSSEPYKAQILDDGTYGIWSDTEYIANPDGLSRIEQHEPRWQRYATLDGGRMERLKSAIKDCGFFELQAQYKPENEVKDGSKTTWYAQIDGKTHTVETMTGVVVPQLEKLKEAVDTITQEVLDEAHQ